jgi:acyl-CoA thioesterase II
MTGVKSDRPSWIARLLDFARDGDVFHAPQPPAGPNGRLFGGMIAAQALAAAGYTVEPDKRPQSLHLYFVRGGQYGVDVELNVVRTRDGRSFDTRQVTAVQNGKTILEMIASFHRPEPGADWHPSSPAGIAFDDAIPKVPDLGFTDRFDLRTAATDDSPFVLPPFWIKTKQRIEDDPLVQACALTFMSATGHAAGPRRRLRGQPRSRGVVPPAVRPARLASLRGDPAQQRRRTRSRRGIRVRPGRRPGGEHDAGSAVAGLRLEDWVA